MDFETVLIINNFELLRDRRPNKILTFQERVSLNLKNIKKLYRMFIVQYESIIKR